MTTTHVPLTAVDPRRGPITVHASTCADAAGPHRAWDLDATGMAGVVGEIWADEIAAGDMSAADATAATRWHECTGITA